MATPQVDDLEARILAKPGCSVTPQELAACDQFILGVDAAGFTSRILEFHIPVGNILDAAIERLIYEPGFPSANNWQSYTEEDGLGSPGPSYPMSGVDPATLDPNNVCLGMGAILPPVGGDFGGFGPNLMGIQNDMMPFGYSGDLFGRNPVGNTLIWSLSGVLPVFSYIPIANQFSGLYFLNMDGSLGSMIRDNRMLISLNPQPTMPAYSGSPFIETVSWTNPILRVSFVAESFTRAELKVLYGLIEELCAGVGRPLPTRRTRRVLFLGNSLLYGTMVSGNPYPVSTDGGPLYAQLAAYQGWGDETEMIEVGIPGLAMSALLANTATLPNFAEIIDLVQPEVGNTADERVVITELGPNDILGGAATGAQLKARADLINGYTKAAGGIPIFVGPCANIQISGVTDPAWAASVASFVALMDADPGYIVAPAPWDPSKKGYWVKISDIPELSDPADTVGPDATRFVDGVGTTVHLTPHGYSFYIPRLAAAYDSASSGGPPVFTSPDSAYIGQGEDFYFNVEASNTTSFSAVGLPSGLTLNPTTGVIQGQAPILPGSYAFTITAHGSGGDTEQFFNLNVNPTSAMPCARTFNVHTGDVGLLLCSEEPIGDNIITDAENTVTPLNIYDAMSSGFRFSTLRENTGQINFGVSNASLGGMSFMRSISFPVLEETTGAIFANGQIALQTFSAPELEILGAALHLENNPNLVSIDLSSLEQLNGILTANTSPLLTTVTLGTLTAMSAASMNLSGAALNVATVNAILVKLNAIPGLTGKTINLSGGTSAAPTGAGAAAKTALNGAGNTVTTN